MARKTRSDSKLAGLTLAQQEELSAWLTVENISYADAKTRVAEQFGVFSSEAALRGFYAQVAAPWKYARAAGEAEKFAALMEGRFDEATIKRAQQLAFEALSGPRPDLDAAEKLMYMIGDSARIALKEREVSLSQRSLELKVKQYEDKIAAARASLEKARSKGGLDKSTLRLIEEQLNLL